MSGNRVSRCLLAVAAALFAAMFLCAPVFAKGKKNASSNGFYNLQLQKRGMQRLYSGDVKGAVVDFCAMLNTERPSPWTVSIIVLCHEDNVAKTVHRAKGTGPLFVVPVIVNEKPCFRVCAGLYSNRKIASSHVKSVRLEGIETKPFPLMVDCKELAKLTSRDSEQGNPPEKDSAGKPDSAEPSKDIDKKEDRHGDVVDSSAVDVEVTEEKTAESSVSGTEGPMKVDVIVPEEKKTEHVDTSEEKSVSVQSEKDASKKDASKEVEDSASDKRKPESVKPPVEKKEVASDEKTEKKKAEATGNSEDKPEKSAKVAKERSVLKPYKANESKTSLPSKEGRTWFNKGLDALARGVVLEAEADFKEALRADPGRPEILNDLGIVRLRQGRYREAEKLFRQALEKSPNYARARLNLSGALWGLGKKDEALVEAEEAAKLDPDDVSCFLTLASFYLAQGYPDKAAVAAQRALLLDPGNSRARSLLNKCAVESGKK